MKNFSGNKWLIIGNGEAKFSSRESLLQWMDGRNSIALDGAAHLLEKLSIATNALLGDFDSIGRETLHRWRAAGVPCICRGSLESTDMEKALQFAIDHGAGDICIIHGLGGRMDHAMANVFFLKKYARRGIRIVLWDSGQCVEYFSNERSIICGHAGGHCGFFGLPNARITSRGLRYEMKNFLLDIGSAESVANQFLGGSAEIFVQGACIGTYEVSTP
ncbi:MAG: thiamine diphosphokinase [Puniceicoccales bacterium]|jgi:thiamine pyrophosphokinase|nr:thiamine diphosphokinase [Puniceicoccales bacterium]